MFEPDAGRLVDAVIPARHYTRTGGRRVDLVVIHSMEAPEKPATAENVARWFAGPSAPKASAHYCVDQDSIVQGVLERDVAWAAPGANHDGIQVELAGYARQTRSDWFDPPSRAMLERQVVPLVADICRRHRIPAVWLTATDLQAGAKGITSHVNVSRAFRRSDHTDPGAGFPHDWLIAQVRELLEPPVFRAPWTARAGGKVIGRGSLAHPAFIRRIVAPLKASGHRAPWVATVAGHVIARGSFWPLGAFKRAVSARLLRGETVVINDTVTINPKDQP